MSSFKELREQLSPDNIIDILNKYDIDPYYENSKYIIFPTCCHNLTGGSPKLYYYKTTYMFKCYTECNSMFDIFDLLIKIEKLRGRVVSKIDAIELAGLSYSINSLSKLKEESIAEEISHMHYLQNSEVVDINNLNLTPIDADFLDERFTFDVNGLKTWVNEGISLNTMGYYKITFDPIDNCIIIPQFDIDGKIVGVRGRYLNDEDIEKKGKYRPIIYNGKLLSHPTGKTLYGFYQNKQSILMAKTAIIFESEKSVMKLDSLLDGKNISVAVCGKNISAEQMQILSSIGVSNVIIAFDADYRTDEETQNKLNEYKRIAEPLLTYFNVSIIIDFNHLLGYKDSPIDKGIEVFTELMKGRIKI